MKLLSKITSFFKNKKNTVFCDCNLATLTKGKETKLETGVMYDYYCDKHNMTTLVLKTDGHLKGVDINISDDSGFIEKACLLHEQCYYCGLTCNDCNEFGCGTSGMRAK